MSHCVIEPLNADVFSEHSELELRANPSKNNCVLSRASYIATVMQNNPGYYLYAGLLKPLSRFLEEGSQQEDASSRLV